MAGADFFAGAAFLAGAAFFAGAAFLAGAAFFAGADFFAGAFWAVDFLAGAGFFTVLLAIAYVLFTRVVGQDTLKMDYLGGISTRTTPIYTSSSSKVAFVGPVPKCTDWARVSRASSSING